MGMGGTKGMNAPETKDQELERLRALERKIVYAGLELEDCDDKGASELFDMFFADWTRMKKADDRTWLPRDFADLRKLVADARQVL